MRRPGRTRDGERLTEAPRTEPWQTGKIHEPERDEHVERGRVDEHVSNVIQRHPRSTARR